MAAVLKQLVHVRSQAADEMLAYLWAMLQQMSQNKLLERFGRKLDDLRVPLRVVPFEPIRDFDTVRARENLRLEGLGDDDDDEKTTKRIYGGRDHLLDEEEKATRPRPEPLAQLEPKLARAVLLGDPGSGKTEWLKHLAHRAVQTAYDQVKDFALALENIGIPAFLRLSDIAAQLRQTDALKARLLKVGAIASLHEVPDDAECVAAAMLNALVAHHKLSERLTPLVWQQWFTAPPTQNSKLETQNSLLCLDAWDEARASDEEKQRLAQCLTAFAHKAHARIFLTSRIIGYSHQPLPVERKAEGTRREMQILPFEWNETEQFVTSFFGADEVRGQQMLADLRGKIAVAGMAQNPLLSTLFCMAFSPSKDKDVKSLEFPARRVEVYEKVLEGLLGEWAAKQKNETPDWELIEEKILLLEEMAYDFFPDERLERKRLRFFLRDQKKGYIKNLDDDNPIKLMLKGKRTTITRELNKDGVLVPFAGNQSGDHLFLHLTFQEYLTASALARRANAKDGGDWERIKAFVDAKAWAPEWEEVIILMAGKLDDPIPLFEMLGNAERDDTARSRLCLLARCLPELASTGRRSFSRALPQEVAMNEEKLTVLAAQTAQEVFDLWWEQREQGYEFFTLSRGLRAIAQSGQETIIATALRHLHDGGEDERRRAAKALETMGATAATAPVLTALVRALYDANGEVRWGAAKALETMGATAATALMQDLQNADGGGRWIIANILGAIKAPTAINPFLTVLVQDLYDANEDVIWMAFKSLDEIGITTALRQALHDTNKDVRKMAVKAIGAIRAIVPTKPVPTTLVQGLYDADWKEEAAAPRSCVKRSKAYRALGAIRATVPTAPVLTAWVQDLDDADWEVRMEAVDALGAMGAAAATAPVLTALVRALYDSHRKVRDHTVYALKAMGAAAATTSVLTALVQALHHADKGVHRYAADALRAMGAAAATAPVLASLGQDLLDADEDVRKCAAIVLSGMKRRGVRVRIRGDRVDITTVQALSRWDSQKP